LEPSSPTLVKRGLEIQVNKTYISFGNKRFFRKKGTATGASDSVAYTNILVHADSALTDNGL